MKVKELIENRQFIGEIMTTYKKADGNMYVLVSLENGKWVEGKLNHDDWKIINPGKTDKKEET